MGTVDRSTDHLWVFERVGVFLTAAAKPGHEIGDSRDARGGSISSSGLPMRSRTQAK